MSISLHRSFRRTASLMSLLTLCASGVWADTLVTETVQPGSGGNLYQAEGVVEAVRSSSIGAELSGRLTALLVKVGDHVQSGQVLAKIDERVAAQQALASQSQVAAAQAQLATAQADFERQQKLYGQKFLSKAALDRAESDYKSAAAQARAQIAQAGAAGLQTSLRTLTAPYAGIVAESNVELGDMVMPGKPLLVMYDPTALRVTVNLPQSQLSNLRNSAASIDVTGAAASPLNIAAGNIVALPTADPISHMVQVRINLPTNIKGLSPGMFARAHLSMEGSVSANRVTVASSAVLFRSELTAVYVVNADGSASLRQVRLGRRYGERVEVLSGIDVGERVALDPLAAAKQR